LPGEIGNGNGFHHLLLRIPARLVVILAGRRPLLASFLIRIWRNLTRRRRRRDITSTRLSGSWRRIYARWRRSEPRWWRWRRDSLSRGGTWDLIPLCKHTLHVRIVISPLEGLFVSKWLRASPLASPLPANRVIGLEYLKRLPWARRYRDAWACRNRCTRA